MNPGRDLDVLIAEKVMGIDTFAIQTEPGWEGLGTLYSEVRIPKYSTDIAAAWQVVKKLEDKKYVLVLYRANTVVVPQSWLAKFDYKFPNLEVSEDDFEIAKTVPYAICLAALKAVGVKT